MHFLQVSIRHAELSSCCYSRLLPSPLRLRPRKMGKLIQRIQLRRCLWERGEYAAKLCKLLRLGLPVMLNSGRAGATNSLDYKTVLRHNLCYWVYDRMEMYIIRYWWSEGMGSMVLACEPTIGCTSN